VVDTRPRVFLSYRRSDSQHVAGRAGDKLADRYDLFMDIDAIPPGVDYTDYLRRAVGGCDVLVALIGEHWADATDADGRPRLEDPNDWVVGEISTALARGVAVIPVLVDSARLPPADRLPESLKSLTTRQTVPLRHESFTADLAHLIAGIDHAAAHGVAAEATSTVSAPEPFAQHWDRVPKPRERTPVALAIPPARRRLLLPMVLGVVVLAVVAAGTWFALRPAPTPASAAPQATGSSPVVPTSSTAPGATVAPATTVAQLKSRVPAAFRTTCRGLKPTDPALTRQLVVALQCFPQRAGKGERPQYAFYLQYSAAADAEAAFRSYYAVGAPGDGDCSDGAGEAPDSRPEGDGVLRCYQDADGFRVFAWFSPRQAVVAAAADRDLSFAALAGWWGTAGPLAP
jgi:hypothetical protein